MAALAAAEAVQAQDSGEVADGGGQAEQVAATESTGSAEAEEEAFAPPSAPSEPEPEPAPEPVPLFSQADIDAVEMPEMRFSAEVRAHKDAAKYFIFHRPETSFEEAYLDITECDQLSSGISYYAGGGYAPIDYSSAATAAGGAIGAALGSIMADAIFGSAQRRAIRRINMRNCMGFKGYDRYALEKDLWKAFNFEEGNGRTRDDEREAALLQQAKVASGPTPQADALEI